MENNTTEELIETINEEIQSETSAENGFICNCELDHTEQMEYLISIEEQNLLINQHIYTNSLLSFYFLAGFGVSYLLYKFFKIFL